MEWFGRIVQQELGTQKVEKYPEGSRNSVVRFAILTRGIRNRNFRDARTRPCRERRDKPVQLAIERDSLDRLAAIRLEGRPEIVQ